MMHMKPLAPMLLFAFSPLSAAAETPHFDTAQAAIKAQEGCFEVTFNYEEVEAHKEGYSLADPKTSSVFEWVSIDQESDTQIILQHVLVTPPRIKHWKQIWRFEAQVFDVYSGPDQWQRQVISPETAGGAWVQDVRGVADNPRYACSAPWSLESSAAWTCETWAAKPRRDKDRDDYNVLSRINTHRIVENGWVHEQQNTKLMVRDTEITPIVTERGNNTYVRVDDKNCAEAASWWAERRTTWDQVQKAWIDISAQHPSYVIDAKNGILPLWVRLFWVARKPLPEKRHPRLYKKATRIIERHLKPATPNPRSAPAAPPETPDSSESAP